MDFIQQNLYIAVVFAGFSKILASQDKSQHLLLKGCQDSVIGMNNCNHSACDLQ